MNIVIVRRNWKSHSRGHLVMGTGPAAMSAPCALGRSGITCRKREGDGATPMGAFGVISVFYRPDRTARPNTQLPLHAISPQDGWCDDQKDRNYNKYIRLPYDASHEVLARSDHLYDLMVVLDYNISERKRGAGSAIFFHLAHPNLAPTEGCVAVGESVMRMFLSRATRDTMFVIQG